MLSNLLNSPQWLLPAASLITFILVFVLNKKLMHLLPGDLGRAYAVDAEKAKGKPRGAGIIFVLVFCVMSLIFAPFSLENSIYLILLALAMLTGYLDDASKIPWSDYKKGALDLLVSLGIALNFALNNSTAINLTIIEKISGNPCIIEIPAVVYVILATILVWMAINVVNCTDGVDGLCTTLSIIGLVSFVVLSPSDFSPFALLFVAALLAYLWFNCSPSIMLMGDAGSRTIGVFFAILAMKSGDPLLFIPFCLIFILDGGLGLIKVFLLRFFKIKLFPNTRMPLHDHFRKEKGWSDTQTVMRFAIIQTLICLLLILL